VTVVEQAEVAFRETLGWGRVQLEPGLRWALPIVHKVTRVDLRERAVPVSVEGYTRDNVPVSLHAKIYFRVTDANKACFAVHDLNQNTADVAASTIRALLGTFAYDEIIKTRRELSDAMITEVQTAIVDWGILCTKAEVQEFGPQNASVSKQLEKQLEAERERRKTELDTLARINVAEGEKRATVLAAEGAAAAERVRADAARYAKEQDAEAERVAAQLRGQGRAAEIREIASVFGGDTAAATDFLLQAAKLQHLASIANAGVNTNTYIVPDAGSSLIPTLSVAALKALQGGSPPKST